MACRPWGKTTPILRADLAGALPGVFECDEGVPVRRCVYQDGQDRPDLARGASGSFLALFDVERPRRPAFFSGPRAVAGALWGALA